LPAIANIYAAGVKIAKGIVDDWDCTFEAGIKPTNYVGDIFGSLGGDPDFGPGSLTGGAGYLPAGGSGEPGLARRGMPGRSMKSKV